MKKIDALPVGRERTQQEKQRRHLHGDKGATFSRGKQMCLLTSGVSGCVTTFATKDNLICEIYGTRKIIQRPHGFNKGGEHDESPTVTTSAFADNNLLKLPPELQGKKFRIRKLTPTEAMRLMDVNDDDTDKIKAARLSNSSIYKLAGNSIVVNVLYHIFRKLYIDPQPETNQLTLF